jgi:hypothetical protein
MRYPKTYDYKKREKVIKILSTSKNNIEMERERESAKYLSFDKGLITKKIASMKSWDGSDTNT